MQFALTGAFGHLGLNLLRLAAQKHYVRALCRSENADLHGINAEKILVDYQNIKSLQNAFAGCDAVFHLASPMGLALKKSDALLSETITQNVIDACIHAGVKKLIHFSTVHVYQPALNCILNEDAGYHHTSAFAYDLGKIASEKAVLAAGKKGLHTVILQPASVIGPDDWRPSPQGQMILSLMRNRMPVLIEGGYCWVDARDIAECALAAVERGKNAERYLLAAEYASFREIAQMVCTETLTLIPEYTIPLKLAALFSIPAELFSKLTGSESLLTSFSISAVRNAARKIDTSRAALDLGWKAKSLQSSVKDSIDFFKNNYREFQ